MVLLHIVLLLRGERRRFYFTLNFILQRKQWHRIQPFSFGDQDTVDCQTKNEYLIASINCQKLVQKSSVHNLNSFLTQNDLLINKFTYQMLFFE